MATKIYNVMILDESGSMYNIEEQAVSGLNETLSTIRKAQKQFKEQEHIVRLVTFNSENITTRVADCPIQEVKNLSSRDYCPSSCTPLYDAIGTTLLSLKNKVEKGDKVLVTIITDGCENDSHEYTAKAIEKMIRQLKHKGWVFTYIGANQDVVEVATTISIEHTLAYDATEQGCDKMFSEENKARSRWFERVAKGEDESPKGFFEE